MKKFWLSLKMKSLFLFVQNNLAVKQHQGQMQKLKKEMATMFWIRKLLLLNLMEMTLLIFFVKGAEEVLKIAQIFGIKEAILKRRSPSCGSGHIYDGTFSRTLINGDGVTTALLKRNGIKVISEEEL